MITELSLEPLFFLVDYSVDLLYNINVKKKLEVLMILNAKITSADIFVEDHGCLTFCLSVDSSAGWSTGIGMFDLNGCRNIDVLINDILKTIGVTRWSDMKGRYIRIDDNNKHNSTITKIGNIMTDNWIDLRSYFL